MKPLALHARELAAEIHDGQLDHAGEPYIRHLERVAARVAERLPGDQVAEAVAWLHDSFEDQPGRAHRVFQEMPLRVVRPVLILTKLGGDNDLEAYYRRVRGDFITQVVKEEDVEDNQDPERLALLPVELRERLQAKYARATLLLRQP